MLAPMRKQARVNLATCREMAASCACANLRKATRATTQLYDAMLRPSGLRATQFTLLVATRLIHTAPVTRLAKELGMDRTTLTRNLRLLERQGLIRVRPGRDRRVAVAAGASTGSKGAGWGPAAAVAVGSHGDGSARLAAQRCSEKWVFAD